jgi:hypothetical protein
VQALINITVHRPDAADSEARIVEMIASANFPIGSDRVDLALQRASEAYPRSVGEGLLRRIAAGLELPYRATELLKDVTAVDDGPIAAAALDRTTPERVARGAFAVIGPKTVGTLLDQFFALHEDYDRDRAAWGRADHQSERDEYQRVNAAIRATCNHSFLVALLERADTDQPVRIALMAGLFASHERHDEEERPNISEEMRPALLLALQHWIGTMLASPQADRHQFAGVVRAVTRLADPQFVPGLQRMLERDLADWTGARDEYARARRGGPSPDVTHSYTLEYQRAFAAIGGEAVVRLMKGYLPDLRFGTSAACALCEIWNRAHPSAKAPHFASWHAYSRAKPLRTPRRGAAETLST